MKNERLQRLIKESGLSYKRAAEMIGAKLTTISGWVNGCNLENSTKFYDLCKVMGWNPEYIISGRGEKMISQVSESTNNYGNNTNDLEFLKKTVKEKEYIIELLQDKIAMLEEKYGEGKSQRKPKVSSG